MICLFLFIAFCRIEEDPVWSQVDSCSFDKKFLQNDIPAVVNIATLVKRAHTLSVERVGLEKRLENLREDRQNNSYLPGELYRFIQQMRTEGNSLRSEVNSLRTEVNSLHSQVNELKEFRANHEKANQRSESNTISYRRPFPHYGNT